MSRLENKQLINNFFINVSKEQVTIMESSLQLLLSVLKFYSEV